MQMDVPLPVFETLFGRQRERLRGIGTWEDAAVLGKTNLERLVELAQENARVLMLEDSGARDELRAIRAGIAYLTDAIAKNTADKPLLPRLRVESFRKGESVMVFLGDSSDALAPSAWLPGTITDITKSYKAEWSDGTRNSGYYWRVIATLPAAAYQGEKKLAFSTSEPRVIPSAEFAYLIKATTRDLPFVEIYSENARRPWQPLWCLEHNTLSAGEAMDMKAWLMQQARSERN